MTKKSEFGKLKWTDVLNGLYHAIVATSGAFFAILSLGRFPENTELIVLLSTFGVAFMGDVAKRTVRNSDGEQFKKEK